MGALRLLVLKDLRRRMRSPLGLLIVLSFPIVFAGLIALSFGSHGERVPKIHLLVENQDDGIVANGLLSSLTSARMAEYVDVEIVKEEGAARMEKGEASALLRIPKGFTQDLVDGTPTSLTLVRNPAQGILPEIAEQLTRVLVDVLDSSARVLKGPLEQIRPFVRSDANGITDASVTTISLAVKHAADGAGRLIFPPAISIDTKSLEPAPADGEPVSNTGSIFLLILPGISVYALFLVGDLAMRDIIAEATAGTLRRQLAGPIGAGTLVLGKAIYTAVLSLLALVLISIVGALVLGRSVDPAGFVLLSLALVMSVTGASSVIYAVARNERVGATISSIVYLVLGFAGGSFINLEGLPKAARAIAPLSPFYWGTTGYRDLIESAGTLGDVLPNVAVLAGLGAACLALGALLLQRTLRRGGLA